MQCPAGVLLWRGQLWSTGRGLQGLIRRLKYGFLPSNAESLSCYTRQTPSPRCYAVTHALKWLHDGAATCRAVLQCLQASLEPVQTFGRISRCMWYIAGPSGLPDTANRSTPAAVLVLFPEAIVSIAAGQGFSAAVSLSGRVFTWGRGKYGALGSGRVEDRATPCPVPSIADAIQVSLWHAPVHDL